jgi:dethiobiotin synthetase
MTAELAPARKGVFIAGTDTGVGKTHVAVALVRALAALRWQVAVMKPIAAGTTPGASGPENADAVALMAASNVAAPYPTVNPYPLAAPVSPHLAARAEHVTIELPIIEKSFARLAASADVVVVEGAGGWHAPLTDSRTMADVAVALRVPVLLVVGMRLGCLNHALLTADALAARGVPLAGWVANCIDPHMLLRDENIATLTQRFAMEPIATAPFEARQGVPPQLKVPAATDAVWTNAANALAARLRLGRHA